MASMAAIGVVRVPSSSTGSNASREKQNWKGGRSSECRRSLSFSASNNNNINIASFGIGRSRRSSSETENKRKPRIVSPKAVSDSRNSQTCLEPDASRSVLGIILGGGAGTRLYPLTKKRAKPAVPLGANYRLIDIPVSNCLNSNVSKIYVLTQFNSASLNRHLSRAYASNMGGYKNEGFVEVLAAQQSPENPNWFQGTADAVRQYLWLFEEHNVLEFLVLAGDHLYRMDYERFIQAHRETDADITVAALPMDEKRATAFGLMKIDEEGRIIEFAEKPKGEQLKAMRLILANFHLLEGRQIYDVRRAAIVNQNMSYGIAGNLQCDDQCIVMRVEDFAGVFFSHYVFGECKLFVRNERFLLLPFLQLSHEFLPVGVSEVLPLEVVAILCVVAVVPMKTAVLVSRPFVRRSKVVESLIKSPSTPILLSLVSVPLGFGPMSHGTPSDGRHVPIFSSFLWSDLELEGLLPHSYAVEPHTSSPSWCSGDLYKPKTENLPIGGQK
uniref:glucose-1-phosphate adenylyltransferase n=1 Tax=Fagus sylvatica TaxID=28930 RepID=A0A2N9GLE2_FAGSY